MYLKKIGYMYVLKFIIGILNYLLNIILVNLKYICIGYVCIKFILWYGFFYLGFYLNCNIFKVGVDKEE